jgi:hypothetical protein
MRVGAHIAIDLCLVAWLATASSFDITFNISYYYYTSGLRANTSMVAAGGLESAAA